MQDKYLVIGDVCRDITVYVKRNVRVNPEDAQVPLWTEVAREEWEGMAGNYSRALSTFGLPHTLYCDSSRSAMKTRYFDVLTHEYLLRSDSDVRQNVLMNLTMHHHLSNLTKDSILIVADYQKGAIGDVMAAKLADLGLKWYVDTKNKDLTFFEKATVKVNEQEYSSLKDLGKVGRILVTLGSRGSVLYDNNRNIIAEYHGSGVNAQNVSGAGDVFFSAFIYAENELKYSPKDSLVYATCAAGLSIQHTTTYIPTKKEIDDEFNKATG